ncbi:acetyl-CoA acetyltransferase [Desulfuromonas soudanensis]|uniref:Acetyl-CoA acetyltransferase n=1 Tax=Desulfuromonas soudanensis TaxID=1603606 RepID=A0A0M4D3Y5_9BACT|nr:thiolase family protein [Desulfuromonas soudanensis]ALC15210.1 acetyl-CoA acetyltransferase [Desulfuromonas soudanensis]
MSEVFLLNALRTPFGSFGGALADVPAPTLAAGVIGALLKDQPFAFDRIDEVILGQVLQGGSGQAPARQAMRQAGLPDRVHAMTINKVCGSGLKSIMLAADGIRLGESQLALAGGMESMSLAPYALQKARFGQRMGHGEILDLMIYDALQDPDSGRHMGEITEAWVAGYGLTRQEQDAFAARSYRRARAAVVDGRFEREIVPVVKSGRKGEVTVDRDEEPFRGDPEKLSTLRPAFSKTGTLTAGNASTINDGAALALLAGTDAVREYGLNPLAKIAAAATNSLAPELFGEAPVEAIRRVVARGGISLDQVGLFEINEAFAAVPLIAIRQLGLDPERVNVNGGACAIGHPVGASGARLLTTLLHEMQLRRERYGIATLCIGGGEAVAVLIELL